MTDEKCPQCKKLAERLEWLKERNEANLNANLDLHKHLCDLAHLLGREDKIEADTKTTDVVDWGIAEIKRLKKIVDRLPKTADGVPAVPGVRVWPRGDLSVEGEEGADVVLVLRDKITGDDMDFFRWDSLYSTREAAEAAKDDPEAQTPP